MYGRIFVLMIAALLPAAAAFAGVEQAFSLPINQQPGKMARPMSGGQAPQAAGLPAAAELPPEFVLPEPELPGGVLNYSEAEVPEAGEALSGWAVLGRLFGSLAIVLGLIVITAFVLKRMLANPKHASARGAGKLVQVIQTFPLGGKRQIYLVKVAGRVLVIGCSGDNLSLLTDLPEDEVVAGAETVEAAIEQSGKPASSTVASSSTKRSEFCDLLKTVGRQIVAGGVS